MTTSCPQFTFIDLFAGIGGMRLAFEAVGGKCVFSSEWDRSAQEAYRANFGETPAGDIRLVRTEEIPEHDILLAGFPCQSFSIAGVTKKKSLGRPHGFHDRTQGTLFFEIRRILAAKKPKAFLLENVKHLMTHDKGNTFRIIRETLTQELGYDIHYQVLDARVLVPQHRERVFIAGFNKATPFEFPKLEDQKPRLRDILEANPSDKYTLSDHLWRYLQDYAKKHRAAGNGFGYSVADLNGVSRTLSARYYKDGSEILLAQRRHNPRRLTPRECARLMGFDDNYKIVVSDTQAYKQFGNSVVVPVVERIAREMVKCLFDQKGLGQSQLPELTS